MSNKNTDVINIAGAGGHWPIIDEVVDSTIVRQKKVSACGPACGEMLLRDRNVVISQSQIGEDLTDAKGLSDALNQLDDSGCLWKGGALSLPGGDIQALFTTLNNTGSWAAMMWETGNKVGHWVVVDGLNLKGRVLIRDPMHGTKYKMSYEDFLDYWTEYAVYKL